MGNRGDFFGGSFRDHCAAVSTSPRTKINHKIRVFDDVEIVFDHNNRITCIHQMVEQLQKFLDVIEMKSGGGLVQNVERSAARSSRQLPRELDPLRFTPGKGRRCLAQSKVSEADLSQCIQPLVDWRDVGEQLQGLVDG